MSQSEHRILLSPPDMGETERALLLEAFDSNWIAPLGPFVDRFEAEFAAAVDRPAAAALSSGTAALHLALLLEGVGPGDEVLVPTLTFAATANAVKYVGAVPVFVDSEQESWNIDPDVVECVLETRAASGAAPAAVIAVDIYGQCANYPRLNAVCAKFGVPLIADAAEALGATQDGRPAGSQTNLAAFSFNGNKIMTTSGGGMLVGTEDQMARARYLASQARQPFPYYEHTEVGYNYRMSNLLAAIGVGQLSGLSTKLDRRREIFTNYETSVEAHDGVEMIPIVDNGTSNHWLSVIVVNEQAGTSAGLIDAMSAVGIEARHCWKPMHLQPIFVESEYYGGEVASRAFETGVCLPSGSSLTETEQQRVIETLVEWHAANQKREVDT